MNHSNYLDIKPPFVGPQVTQHGSHMVMTNVVKEKKTKHLALDTKFSQGNQDLSLASYSFSLPERITDIESITVSSVHLPLTFYNISKQMGNNSFQLCFDDVIKTIIIPDGFYTLTDLSNTINGLLSPLSIEFTISSGPQKIGVSSFELAPNATQTSFKIYFNTDGMGNPSKWDLKTRLGWTLGFRLPSYTVNLSSPSIDSEGMLNMYTLKYLFLVLDEFSSSSHSATFHSFLPNSLLNKNILAHISIDSQLSWGSFQNATLQNGLLISDTRHFCGNRVDLQKCQVQLVDEFGRIISLNHNDFSFVLELGTL